MSLLIFGTLTCGSPDVALIGIECDNFNDHGKQAKTNQKTRCSIMVGWSAAVCVRWGWVGVWGGVGGVAFEVQNKQQKDAFYVAPPSLRQAR